MLKSSGNFACVTIVLALATIFLSMAANTAHAAERNLRVSYSAPATAFLPLWAAKDAGIFERRFLIDQRIRMQSFVKALVESIHYVKTNPETALKILQRYTRMADREILKSAYDEYAQKVWPRSPAIEPDDIKLILEHLAQINPKAREIQPAALIYNDLVENVARSGIVERLYK